MKSSLLWIVSILALSVLLVGVVQAAEVTIRLGSAFEPTHILCQAAEQFKKLVEERSNGAIEVQLFLGGVMGSEEECTEAVSIGALEMQVGGGLPIKTFAPQYYFFDSPYVMKDWDHFQRVWASPLGDKAREELIKNGNTMYLGIVYRGLRHLTANKPVYTPDDLKGIKLRLPQLPTWVKVWEAIGASTVPIALTELFTALQTGVADASEGDVTQILSFRLYEVQKYLMLTGHLVQTGGLTINKPFFDKLKKEYQDIILQAGKEATEWASNTIVAKEEELIKELGAKGMQIVQPDVNAFRERAKAAVEELFKTEWPVTTWEEVLSY
ncbi:MAG: TRAP transporter substrate-binding protein [Candidatus Caldatribacteriaceae bacterium]